MSTLPASLDAERAVLGAILLDPDAYQPAADVLKPDDFSHDAHRRIFAHMVKLRESGKPVDPVLLTEELMRAGELEVVGGVAFLPGLTEGLPRSTNVRHYVAIVREKAVLRRVIHAGQKISRRAQEGPENVSELLAWAKESIPSSNGSGGPTPLLALELEELLSREIKPREMLLDPVLPEQGLVMVYAKRGDGKTYFALGMAVAVAGGGTFLQWKATRARRVLYVDGELPAKTLQERCAMLVAGADIEPGPGMLKLITPDLQEGPMPDPATVEGQAALESHLKDVDLLILDNLSALCRQGKENEGESWLPVQEWALSLRRRGMSVLFVHHAGKSGLQRGTSRREDLLDTVITLRRPADYSADQGLRCEVHFEKTRGMFGERAKPFEVKLDTGPGGAAVWTMRDLEHVKEEQAFELYDAGSTVREVAEALGISKSKAGRIRALWSKNAGNARSVPLSQPPGVGQWDKKGNGGGRAHCP